MQLSVLTWASTKMALAAPSQFRTPWHAKQLQLIPAADDESDTDLGITSLAPYSDSTPPDLLRQFERMLTKALKQTSGHRTDKLSQEIRELGQRTAEFEQRVGHLDILNHNHTDELDPFGGL